MKGQLIHESVLIQDLPEPLPKARLPSGWQWNVNNLRENKCLEPDPYISVGGLLDKLNSTEVLLPGDRGVLTTLLSSGTRPLLVLSIATVC
jgi:hypothetical protein